MAPEIYKVGKGYAFRCKGCGHVEPSTNSDDLFVSAREAEIALQLHKIGCKKS